MYVLSDHIKVCVGCETRLFKPIVKYSGHQPAGGDVLYLVMFLRPVEMLYLHF